MFPFVRFIAGSAYIIFYDTKWFCQSDCSEMVPAMSFISSFITLAVMRNWPDTEMKIFHFVRN